MIGVIDSIYALLRKQSDVEKLLSENLELGFKMELAHLSPRGVRKALDEAITSALFNDRLALCKADLPFATKGESHVRVH